LFKREIRLFPSFGLSQLERILFFRNLAAMMSAGLSLSLSLSMLEDQVRDRNAKRAIAAMAHDVNNGRRLSAAMAKYPSYFSQALVETVTVGEVAGVLSAKLDRIADDLEKDYTLSRKVLAAIAYPVIVLFVMVAVLIGLVIYVLPNVAKLFAELNAPLPLITSLMLSTSAFIVAHGFTLLAIMVALLLALYFVAKRPWGRHAIHTVALRLPVVGLLIKEFNLVVFFRSLNSLIGSGSSLVDAVEISKKTLKNSVYRRALEKMRPALINGAPLTEALRPYPYLFPMQSQRIVGVGEQTGRFEETFGRLTTYYERSLEHRTEMMTTLLEPILVLVVGFFVGSVALTIFLPLYQVANVI